MRGNPMRREGAAAVLIVACAVAEVCHAQVPVTADVWFIPIGSVDGHVRIHAAGDANVCLETDGAWLTNHDRVQMFHCYGSNGTVPGTVQEWLLIPAGRGASGALRWRLANREFGKCLDTTQVSGSISAQPCNGAAGQQWEFVPNTAPPSARGQFSLRSVGNGLVLDHETARDGSALRLTAFANSADQSWHAVSFVSGRPRLSSPNYVHAYRIELQSAPGKVLDVWGVNAGDNIPIQAWDWHGGSNQKFGFFPARDVTQYPPFIEAGFLSILARHSDKAMEVFGFSQSPGARVEQWTWFGTINQAWVVLPARDDQHVHLINANSGLALQPADGPVANGTTMTQANFDGSAHQGFRLIPVP
jgi:hypothetical protein